MAFPSFGYQQTYFADQNLRTTDDVQHNKVNALSGVTLNTYEVTEFSNDATLSDASTTALVTESAIKSYVDSTVTTTEHNDLSGLQGGNGSTEYYHLDQSYYNTITSDEYFHKTNDDLDDISDGTTHGKVLNTSLTGNEVTKLTDSSGDDLTVDLNSADRVLYVEADSRLDQDLTTDATSVAFGSVQLGGGGATVDEFSTDGTFADDSDTAVPTEKAILTYLSSLVEGLFYIDHKNSSASGAKDNGWGDLTGDVDSSNKTFVVSQGAYVSGTVKVYWNGQLYYDFDEDDPATGSIVLEDAPKGTGNVTELMISYLKPLS